MKRLIPLLLASLLGSATVAHATDVVSKNGDKLVASNGMTLYTFDKDSANRSNCYGKCAENWPPLLAAENVPAKGDLATTQRDDKTWQYTWQGKPLYLWVKDQKPGDTTGDGVNNVWHIAR